MFVPKGPWMKCILFLIPSLCFNNSCLEHLLDNGADPSMVNSKGYSAVHYAAYHGNKQNLELVSFSVFNLKSQLNLPQALIISVVCYTLSYTHSTQPDLPDLVHGRRKSFLGQHVRDNVQRADHCCEIDPDRAMQRRRGVLHPANYTLCWLLYGYLRNQ